MYCSSSPVPSVATTSAWVSPRVNSAEPWARGSTPTSATIGAHGLDVAAVDALAGVEDVPAHDLGFEFLEHAGDAQLVVFRLLALPGKKCAIDLLLGGVDRGVALLLDRDRVGRAQLLLDQAEHLLFERGIVDHRDVARLLGRLLGQLDDRLDHRLEVAMTEHHGAEHDLFGQFLGFGLHHQHRVGGAGDDQIEAALGHLVELRVEHVLVVDEADAARRRSGP